MITTSNFSLVEADQASYSKFFATYRKNIWFRPSWNSLREMMMNASSCFWIYKDNKRIAGISLSDDTLGSFFFIPPFSFTTDILIFLKDYMMSKTEALKTLNAYNVLPEHVNDFINVGFYLSSSRKCMIRPTEKVEIPCIDNFLLMRPEQKHLSNIVDMVSGAYKGGVDEREIDTYRQDVIYYLEHNQQEELLEASSILINKETNKIVGICLVSIWEELPLIYEVAVSPMYRGQGLGKYMLCRAIRYLEPTYPVLRLFVTSGNIAEYLYANLGFLAGEETSHLVFNSIDVESSPMKP